MKAVVTVAVFALIAMASIETFVRTLDERTHRYERALSVLDTLNIADTRIHNGVLELRAGLLHDYDRIVEDQRRAQGALTRLQGLAEPDASLTASVGALQRDYRAKSAQLELFKSQNALLANSLAYFWHESGARMLDDADPRELRRLGALYSAMHRLNTDSSAQTQALVRTRLDATARGRGPSPLLLHGRMLLELLPATQAAIARMRPVAELPSYRRARAHLQQRTAALDALRGKLLLCMLVMGAIMVAMLAHLTLLLRRRACALRIRSQFDQIMLSIARELIGSDRMRLDRAIAIAVERIAAWLDLAYSALILDGGGAGVSSWPQPHDARMQAATAAALALPAAADNALHDMAAVADAGTAALLSCSDGQALRQARWIFLRRHSSDGIAMLCLQCNTRRHRFAQHALVLGLLYGALDTLADAVIRRRLEDEANALELRLERARRMETIGTMASGISHNINNIVGAIRANAEMALSNLPAGAPAHSPLVAIQRATGHASDLIQAVLCFGRAQNRDARLVELTSLLEETQTLLRAAFSDAVTLTVRIDQTPLHVRGSASQLQQVILNLVHNAVQAMGRQGVVAIRLGADENTLRMSVADRGIGIPEDRLEQIFDPFYTTRRGGTGLGLATVRQIVANHEGRIQVRSRVGAGTTFVVELPRCRPCATELQQGARPRHRRLLLLCQDPAALERLEDMLAALGHEPIGHLRASAARAMLRDQPGRFDGLLVHCDDADAAVDALRSVAPQLPLLLLLGPGQTPPRARWGRVGYQLLATPYSPGTLAQALERTCAGSAAASDSALKSI